MHGLSFFLSLLCLTAVGFSLAAIYAAREFFSRAPKTGADFSPPISILKPVRGSDGDAYENLASFCRQDYPQYQVIFGVRDEADPARGVLARLIRDFPKVDIQVVRCDRDVATNPKVSSLIQIQRKAGYPFWLVCDSDIGVDRDYLRRLIQPMVDPAVGAVTCMYRSLSKGWIGTLEALRESTEFCPHVLVARKFEGIRFGLGSSILVRREALDQIGGMSSIADYLADDFLLGNRVAKAGYTVVLSDVVVQHELSITSFSELLRRQIRWNRGIRVCRPWGYRGLLFTYGVPASRLLLLATHGSALGWALFGVVWISRLAMAHIVGARYLSDRAARKFLGWVPVQDLVSFVLWCVGLFGNVVSWRDQTFRLTKEGKLLAIHNRPPEMVRSVCSDVSIPIAH